MSFAVFGASPEEAKKLAEKRMKSIKKRTQLSCASAVKKWTKDRELSALDRCVLDISKHGDISQSNYDAALIELSDEFLKKMAPKQISPLYGSPARCQEFAQLAARYGAERMTAKQRVRQSSSKKAGKFETIWQDVKAWHEVRV